jgi:hypothetical protein
MGHKRLLVLYRYLWPVLLAFDVAPDNVPATRRRGRRARGRPYEAGPGPTHAQVAAVLEQLTVVTVGGELWRKGEWRPLVEREVFARELRRRRRSTRRGAGNRETGSFPGHLL